MMMLTLFLKTHYRNLPALQGSQGSRAVLDEGKAADAGVLDPADPTFVVVDCAARRAGEEY